MRCEMTQCESNKIEVKDPSRAAKNQTHGESHIFSRVASLLSAQRKRSFLLPFGRQGGPSLSTNCYICHSDGEPRTSKLLPLDVNSKKPSSSTIMFLSSNWRAKVVWVV